MSDDGKPRTEENRRPLSGPVSSPRAYFGQASRAATRSLRAGISEVPDPTAALPPRQPPVYHAGDPALRLFADFALPLPPTAPLTGAVVTLSGIRDGEHEKLFIDLGTSLVRSAPRRDETAGTLSLVLSRTQSVETYTTLLASLRYVNDAAEPTKGVRVITLLIVSSSGRTQKVGSALFAVGEAQPGPADEVEARDHRIVIGEKVRFNTDGDYTLYWWPKVLPGALDRAAEAARRAKAGADAAGIAGSYFSAGGKLYRLFDAPERATSERGALDLVSRERARGDRGASDFGSAERAALLRKPTVASAANDSMAPPPRAASDAVWVPGRGVPPPGFERARMLRLEDVFGSDMQDAIARRLIEHRLAAGG